MLRWRIDEEEPVGSGSGEEDHPIGESSMLQWQIDEEEPTGSGSGEEDLPSSGSGEEEIPSGVSGERRWRLPLDGLTGSVDGLGGPVLGFLFFLLDLRRRARQPPPKSHD